MVAEKNLAICIALGSSGDRFQKQTQPRLDKHLDGERPKFRLSTGRCICGCVRRCVQNAICSTCWQTFTTVSV